jgi:hypothetical protein
MTETYQIYQPDNPEVAKINQLHIVILTKAREALDAAIEAGGVLIKERAKIPHGHWGSWIRTNLDVSEWTVRNYIRVHEDREKLKREGVHDLSSAYKVLSRNDLPESLNEEKTRLKTRLQELEQKESQQARKKPVRKKRIASSPARERCPVCERIMTKAILARIKKKKSDGQSS